MTEKYPKSLQPDHIELLKIDNSIYPIPGANLLFDRWTGHPIKNTFGGKPIVNYSGKPMFAELALYHIAVADGWDARWIETYGSKASGPYLFTDWADGGLAEQISVPLENKLCQQLLAQIAQTNRNSYSGCWDVLIWNDKRIIFLESKRYKKDNIRTTQLNWLKAGLGCGMQPDNFLIVQWDFNLG